MVLRQCIRPLLTITPGNFEVLTRARTEEPDPNDEGLVQEASEASEASG